MSYIKTAITGFSWQTMLKISSALVTLLKISILARLLTPDDFGLFSLTVIALGMSEAAAQTGINLTILQSKRSMSYFLDTAWVISIARGFIIAIMMTLVGFGLGQYFDNQQLVWLVGLTSLVPVIKGFINPSIITLRKELRFFRDSLYHFSLVVAEGVVAVVAGLFFKSVLALIAGLIGAAIFEVIISFRFFPLKPRFRYLRSRAKLVLDNARWLSIASLLGYLNDNLDDFVLGKMVGTHQLGIYHNAYALSHKANYDLARSVHWGTLPIYTRMLAQPSRLKKANLKTIAWTGLLLTLTSMPLFLFPELMVNIILGSQWLAAVPLIKWLTLAGIIHSLALLSYTLFMAQSSYKLLNSHQLVNLVLTIGLMIYWGQQQGLIGAVVGLVVGRALALPIIIYAIFHQHHH